VLVLRSVVEHECDPS